jgi:hypothetical protein
VRQKILRSTSRICRFPPAGIVPFSLALLECSLRGVPSTDDAIQTLRDLASPVAAFVRDRCEVGPNHEVEREALFREYRIWCEDNGYLKSPQHVFGRDLKAAFPAIRDKRTRQGERCARAQICRNRPRALGDDGLDLAKGLTLSALNHYTFWQSANKLLVAGEVPAILGR